MISARHSAPREEGVQPALSEAPGSSAILSPCGLYRLRLERPLSNPSGPVISLGMVNPSTADATADDHTIRKCIGFGNRLGGSRLIVWNKFAFRATDIRGLRTAFDPIGPDNDAHIEAALRDSDLHLVAWGPLTKLPPLLRGRWRDVVEIARRVGCQLHALATAQCGHPKHPLMLSYDCRPSRWTVPVAPRRPEADTHAPTHRDGIEGGR